jgi:RNAse (barnase) inhibitor barstar
MSIIAIDCADFTNEDTMHTILKEKFDFPAYYGKNFDALNDCLKGWDPSDHVVMYNIATAYKQLGEETVLSLLSVLIHAFSTEPGDLVLCTGPLSGCQRILAQ